MSQPSLLPGRGRPLLGFGLDPDPPPAAAPAISAPPARGPRPRSFGDAEATRSNVFDAVFDAASTLEPVANQRHTLHLCDVAWADPDRVSKREHKRAILEGRTLGRRLRGTWELVDNATGAVVDRRTQVVARVPYMTGLGTFVRAGSDYTLNHQQRLKPGVFVRVKENGEVEAHANVLPGQGVSHRYLLDPAKGVFQLSVGQANLPLMPLLRAMGVTDDALKEAWGPGVFAANYGADDPSALSKLYGKVLRKADREGPDPRKALVDRFATMAVDPFVTRRTLGREHAGLAAGAILDATRKILAVHRGEAEPDDRDHLAYQRVMGPEDFFAERLARDHGRLRRGLLAKVSFRGSLAAMPSGALTPQLDQALVGAGLSQVVEEINPGELLDKQTLITRMGEGGIPSADVIPDEARAVQPSHMGYIDPLRTPESLRAGVDTYLARGARKLPDGSIATRVRDVRTGRETWKTPAELADAVVAAPGSLARDLPRIPAVRGGRDEWVRKHEVDFELPRFEEAFSPLANLVPLKSMNKGQRVAMGARMLTQALPLVDAEAPHVRAGVPGSGGRSYEEEYAGHFGALHAPSAGVVRSVDRDKIVVRTDDGRDEEHELYDHHPFARKTFIHQTPVVRPGDRVASGGLLARSNFTDDKGHAALGRNARTAYVSWGGKNYEDAFVISEGFAKKFTSEHMYQHDLPADERTDVGKRRFLALFPGKHRRHWLDAIGDDGLIRPGETVEYGQPLILAVREREQAHNKVHKPGQAGYADTSVSWEHHDPGVVTDVAHGKDGPVVVVKATSAMKIGDKMAGRHGDKGVVAAIVPDHRMPHDERGQPFEVLANPLGLISRTNAAQAAEAALGKVAMATGRHYAVEDFGDVADALEYARGELARHGLSAVEAVVDPDTGRRISPPHYEVDPATGEPRRYGNGVLTGGRYYVKLQHSAESKAQGRSSGAYTSDETPAKGGPTGSKRISLIDSNALLSHGATQVLRDATLVRGQRNDEYWLKYMQGYNPEEPRVPFVYRKFVEQLRGAGVNVVRDGPQVHIMAMTDPDVDRLAGDRELRSGETVHFDRGLEPVPGGLFDPQLTGGHGGRRWAAIRLHEPMLNPVMEEPARRLLGLTQKQLEGVIAGDHHLRTGTGPAALKRALDELVVPREIAQARAQARFGSRSARDAAVRRLGYLKSLDRLGMSPGAWVMSRVPVLPPAFRPVSVLGGSGTPMAADANWLYKELLEADSNLKAMSGELGAGGVGPERLAVYNALKAVTGLGDPIGAKTKEKKIKGLLRSIFGSSPKLGTVQRRLISATVDQVGRGVVLPNPALDMDSIGLPEPMAFQVYQKDVVRALTRRGMPVGRAMAEVRDRSPRARDVLLEEMDKTPVIVNRAPVLHKFGIMAFRPRLVAGHTLHVSPLVVKGFGMDFDGDAVQFHVPGTEAARREAEERMLPSRSLLSPSDFKSPVHMPGQEYLAGLFHLTSPTTRSEASPRYFRTRKEAIAAHARGEIAGNDPVAILEA